MGWGGWRGVGEGGRGGDMRFGGEGVGVGVGVGVVEVEVGERLV